MEKNTARTNKRTTILVTTTPHRTSRSALAMHRRSSNPDASQASHRTNVQNQRKSRA